MASVDGLCRLSCPGGDEVLLAAAGSDYISVVSFSTARLILSVQFELCSLLRVERALDPLKSVPSEERRMILELRKLT